jgi:hypothetical protein
LKVRSALSKAIGLSFLIRALFEAAQQPDFKNLQRLLPSVTKSNPIMTEKSESDESRNKVFELEMSSIFLAGGWPTETFAEPDIRIHSGEAWDIACKMIYTENPVTLADSLEKGMRQSLTHGTGYGLVALGISNRLDHNTFMPLIDKKEDVWGSFVHQDLAFAVLEDQIQTVTGQIMEQAATRFGVGRGAQRFRGILIMAHTICGIGKVPVTLSRVALVDRHDLFGDYLIGPEYALCKQFNEVAMTLFAK